ncbi:diacylglycerol/polyprenol kinase family protein [Candidatus Roseilinea sp. NK_OTU-006]|jgi:phytol kinase|uniref:diacylglycerol/polyprenol kinase family protein n=1 Tax=Candidatus Roseilinea sp. NK_OTU-006 TaxID=2704250 RepID=UPI00145CAF32|nr:phosphatidate cytidylyltransferase [Candidatus Roseilinea sp. NK_OTU-006]
MNNGLAIVISFVYVFAALGIAEALRRVFRLPVEFTRKVVHIGVGMWAFGTAALFSDKWFAITPPLVFVALNYLSYRRALFTAMETGDKSNLGTVYFPIAFAAIIVLFFDVSKPFMVAALMPLTWGDAFAAIIGRRYGRRRYARFAQRSIEGSAAMFGCSFLSAGGALLAFGTPFGVALTAALLMALFATLVEAVSPAGLDNLLVPASSALVYPLLIPLLGPLAS